MAGARSTRSTETLAPRSPSSALTAISNCRARPRAQPRREPGAHRGLGRSRGRASRAALSSERAGVPPRCRKSPAAVSAGPSVPSRRVLCPGSGDLERLPYARLHPSRQPPPLARRVRRLKIARGPRGGDPGQNGGGRYPRGARQAAGACPPEEGREAVGWRHGDRGKGPRACGDSVLGWMSWIRPASCLALFTPAFPDLASSVPSGPSPENVQARPCAQSCCL